MWGRDHWSTLAYIETRCVDHDGVLLNANMRTSTRHPLFMDPRLSHGGGRYPTRLKQENLIENHDDWDCLWDMFLVGYVEVLQMKARNGRGKIIAHKWHEYYLNVEKDRERGDLHTPDGELGMGPIKVTVKLTDKGWEIAGKLRTWIGSGHPSQDFDPYA